MFQAALSPRNVPKQEGQKIGCEWQEMLCQIEQSWFGQPCDLNEHKGLMLVRAIKVLHCAVLIKCVILHQNIKPRTAERQRQQRMVVSDKKLCTTTTNHHVYARAPQSIFVWLKHMLIIHVCVVFALCRPQLCFARRKNIDALLFVFFSIAEKWT